MISWKCNQGNWKDDGKNDEDKQTEVINLMVKIDWILESK